MFAINPELSTDNIPEVDGPVVAFTYKETEEFLKIIYFRLYKKCLHNQKLKAVILLSFHSSVFS